MATTRAQSLARASSLAATSSAQSFASAAVAASVGVAIPAGQAQRHIDRRLVTTVISFTAARVPRRGQATDRDPHLSTRGVQRRRRRCRIANLMLKICQGCPRHTAGQSLPAACGQMRLYSTRGHSLERWAEQARCRSCYLWSRDMETASTTLILVPFGASSRSYPVESSVGCAITLRPCASSRSECFQR